MRKQGRSFTQLLASFVVDTPGPSIPQDALYKAKLAVIDTVAVAIAGTTEPVGRIAHECIQEVAAAPQASIWGTRLKSTIAEAAMANGTCSHALDFDDALPSMRGHTSAVLVPAALAVGEATGASGREVLESIALGTQVLGTLGRAAGNGHYDHGWHATSTLGVFGAAAVAARLWRMDAARLQMAWGLAASHASGLTRNFGTMAKPFHAGHAARGGINSAWMVGKGMTAHSEVFEADSGFLNVFAADGIPVLHLLDRLNETWEILQPGLSVKRWPCCYATHRAIAGAIDIMNAAGAEPHDVEAAHVGFLPGSDSALAHMNPQTGLEAKFSMEYAIAAAVMDRELTTKTFSDQMVQRQAVREMMQRVRRYQIPDEKTYSGSGEIGFTDITLRIRGEDHFRRVDRVPGSSRWPLTEEEFRSKVLGCVAPILGEEAANRFFVLGMEFDALAGLESIVATMSCSY